MLQAPYVDTIWSKTMVSLLSLLELPVSVDTEELDELYTFDLEEEGGYQNSFTKLTTANPVEEDPTKGLPPSRAYLAIKLSELPPDLREPLKNRMNQENMLQCVSNYFVEANLPMI